MNEKQRDTLRIYMAMFDKLVLLAVEKDGMAVPEAIKAVKSALVEVVK